MKRRKKMIFLMAALVLLLGAYAMIGNMDETTQVSESKGAFALWADGKTLTALAWEKDGTSYSFTQGESVWMKADDAAFPVNQTAVQNLADKVTALTATTEITDVSQLADYGLDEPVFAVTATDDAGNVITFSMGDATPFEDGYYVSVSGRESIYVIEDSLSSTFNKTLTQLATMETMPEVTNVTRMTVGNTLDVSFDEAAQVWTDTATGEVLDTDAVKTLVDAASSLAWSELIATNASDEELNEWALGEAQATVLTLYSGDTAELTLLLGGKDAETDRYAKLPDSAMVYTFYSDDADEILEASVDTLWQKKPFAMTAEELGEAKFAWDGGEKTLTADDAQAETTASIFELLGSIEGTERIEAGMPESTILTVSLTSAEGGTQEVYVYAYNVDSYLIPITDTHGMLVPAEDIDKLIRMLKQNG